MRYNLWINPTATRRQSFDFGLIQQISLTHAVKRLKWAKSSKQDTNLNNGSRPLDISGHVSGRLTAISLVTTPGKRPGAYWNCECQCGTKIVVFGASLRRGTTKSCGCLLREHMASLGKSHRKHGKSGTKSYRTWAGIITRCHNPNCDEYHNYGGRGIAVCQGWRLSSSKFFLDMGEPPTEKHSIDRIENDRGYDCGHCEDCRSRNATQNCRWSTPQEQSRNRRNSRIVTFNGQSLTISEWAEKLTIPSAVLYKRIAIHGWTIDRAMTQPLKKQPKRTKNPPRQTSTAQE